jgi:hypothetical protein
MIVGGSLLWRTDDALLYLRRLHTFDCGVNRRRLYMTLLFILVTLAHFHFVLVVDTVSDSGALSNCRDCDVIE